MGYAITWTAVRGLSAEAIRGRLGLRGTGKFDEVPEGAVHDADLPGGWRLVWWNRFDFDHALTMGATFPDAEVVACAVEEHVTWSGAAAWQNGRELWAVMHDASKGPNHLHVVGRLPPELDAICSDLLRQQREAGERNDVNHVFDAPTRLAAELTGFRHDTGPFPDRFESLAPIKRPLLRRLTDWFR